MLLKKSILKVKLPYPAVEELKFKLSVPNLEVEWKGSSKNKEKERPYKIREPISIRP